jgi:hypothetical protein
MTRCRFYNCVLFRMAASDGDRTRAGPHLAFRSKLGRTRCFVVRSLRKEKVMAVRILALLIPLAITLPQLQMTRPRAQPPQEVAAPAQPAAAEPAWSYETRRLADAAVTRVVLELPMQEALRTLDSPTADLADSGDVAAGVTPQVRKAPARRAALKPARAASPVKLASTVATPGRLSTRQAKDLPADPGCAPSVHCAPVVVAKVTPVTRRPL